MIEEDNELSEKEVFPMITWIAAIPEVNGSEAIKILKAAFQRTREGRKEVGRHL